MIKAFRRFSVFLPLLVVLFDLPQFERQLSFRVTTLLLLVDSVIHFAYGLFVLDPFASLSLG